MRQAFQCSYHFVMNGSCINALSLIKAFGHDEQTDYPATVLGLLFVLLSAEH